MWVLVAGCISPPEPATFALPESLELGSGPLGAVLEARGTITNTSGVDEQLTFTTSRGFTVEPATLELKAGAAAQLTVRFAVTALGPQLGTLAVETRRSGAGVIRLRAVGTGPALDVVANLVLPPIRLGLGQASGESHGVLRVRNVGTAPSKLTLEEPLSGGPELCVGEFIGTTCVSWIPWEIPAGVTAELPLSLFVVGTGRQAWTVTLRSNDPQRPAVVVNVLAGVYRVRSCEFEGPPLLQVDASGATLELTHVGADDCFVTAMDLQTSPPGALRWEPLSLPRLLHPGEVLRRRLVPTEPPSPFFAGTVTVFADFTAPFFIGLQSVAPPSSCLLASPQVLDFGVVAQGCSASRTVSLYNTCAAPLTLTAQLQSLEFSLVPLSPGTVLLPAGEPAQVTVSYSPASLGVHQSAVRFEAGSAAEVVLVRGTGGAVAHQTDTFAVPPLARAQVMFAVDTSPSFAPRRAEVRTQVERVLRHLGTLCADLRVGFAPAEGAGPVALALNGAGQPWTSSRDAAFVTKALTAFDALPASSETEACLGAVAQLTSQLVPDAGALVGVCITDALEQTVDAGAVFETLSASDSRFGWNVVTGLASSTCPVEAHDDDGAHRAFVQRRSGQLSDVCTDWAVDYEGISVLECGLRTDFFLTGAPRGAINVTVDGQPAAPASWSWSARDNVVRFVTSPPDGVTVAVSYDVACRP
jgi:hypothetical protein